MGIWDKLFRRQSVTVAASDDRDRLERQRKELAASAAEICGRKQFMQGLHDGILALKEMPQGTERDEVAGRLLDSLRGKTDFSAEINGFFDRSEELYKEFLLRLDGRFSGLTASERRLALLLRQGLSSKDMASLLDITPKSVEISRYRLRSKLGLTHSDSLSQFINQI